MLLSGIGNLHNLHVVFYILKKQIDSVHTRNDIGNINSFIRDKHLKRFPLLFSKFIDWPPESPDNQYHLNKW